MGEAIQAALQAHPAVESTSIAGPGFVNVVVSDSWLGERIDSMLTNGIGTWAPALPVSTCTHLCLSWKGYRQQHCLLANAVYHSELRPA